MDVANTTFVGLATLGTVNVILLFKPNLDSKAKWIISVIAAFLLSFVPADLGSVIVNKVYEALQIALAASGGYKVATKAGGK